MHACITHGNISETLGLGRQWLFLTIRRQKVEDAIWSGKNPFFFLLELLKVQLTMSLTLQGQHNYHILDYFKESRPSASIICRQDIGGLWITDTKYISISWQVSYFPLPRYRDSVMSCIPFNNHISFKWKKLLFLKVIN